MNMTELSLAIKVKKAFGEFTDEMEGEPNESRETIVVSLENTSKRMYSGGFFSTPRSISSTSFNESNGLQIRCLNALREVGRKINIVTVTEEQTPPRIRIADTTNLWLQIAVNCKLRSETMKSIFGS